MVVPIEETADLTVGTTYLGIAKRTVSERLVPPANTRPSIYA